MLLARRSDPAAHATHVSPRLAPLHPAAAHSGKLALGAHQSKPPVRNPPWVLWERNESWGLCQQTAEPKSVPHAWLRAEGKVVACSHATRSCGRWLRAGETSETSLKDEQPLL